MSVTLGSQSKFTDTPSSNALNHNKPSPAPVHLRIGVWAASSSGLIAASQSEENHIGTVIVVERGSITTAMEEKKD